MGKKKKKSNTLEKSERKIILDTFYEMHPYFNNDNFKVSLTSKGNVSVNIIPTGRFVNYRTVHIHSDIESSIDFKNADGFDINEQMKYIDCYNYLQSRTNKTNEVMLDLIGQYWYLPAITISSKIVRVNNKGCYISVHIADKNTDFVVNLDNFFNNVDDLELAYNCFLESLEKYLIEYIKKHFPDQIKQTLKAQCDNTSKILKSKNIDIDDINKFFRNTSKGILTFVMGSIKTNEMKKLIDDFYSVHFSYKYDFDKKQYIVKNLCVTYYFDAKTLNLIEIKENKIRKNKTFIRDFKERTQEVSKVLPYYKHVISLLEKYNIKVSSISSAKALDVWKTDFNAKQNGLCYNNVYFGYKYCDEIIPCYLSIPHLLERKDYAKMKKEAERAIKLLAKEISVKIFELYNQRIANYRKNTLVYQSYSAQTLYDFLREEEYPQSLSKICNYLIDGTGDSYISDTLKGKYRAALHGYKKDHIENVLAELVHANLVQKNKRKGCYGSFDVYKKIIIPEDVYKCYFNNEVRKKTEVFNDLKNERFIPRKEAKWVLEQVKENKVKDKDMLFVFNILKNHDFVVSSRDEIIEVFSGLSDNIKLYLSFLIESYAKNSIEQKILKSVLKS